MTHKRTSTVTGAADNLTNYGKRNVTVAVDVIGADGTATAAAATSASKELAEVASGVSSLKVTRGGDGGNEITATWFGPGSPGLDHRVALYVTVDATTNQKEWIVFPGDRDGTAIDAVAETRATDLNSDTGEATWGRWSWTFDLDVDGDDNPTTSADSSWPDDDTGSTHTVDGDDLIGAMMLRVDTRVTGTGAWKKGTPDEIPEG